MGATSLACPRDGKGTLLKRHQGRSGAFVIDACPACGGVWYDKGEISKLTGEREIERLIVDYAAGASEFPCPQCGAQMAKRPVGQVAVDVCGRCHGVWFDRDELDEVVRAVGGEIPVPGTGLLSAGLSHQAAVSEAAFASPHVLKILLAPRKAQFPPPEKL